MQEKGLHSAVTSGPNEVYRVRHSPKGTKESVEKEGWDDQEENEVEALDGEVTTDDAGEGSGPKRQDEGGTHVDCVGGYVPAAQETHRQGDCKKHHAAFEFRVGNLVAAKIVEQEPGG